MSYNRYNLFCVRHSQLELGRGLPAGRLKTERSGEAHLPNLKLEECTKLPENRKAHRIENREVPGKLREEVAERE
jgi:hypothetical protein